MPSKGDITIERIPRHLIPALYGRVYQHIRRGAEVAGRSLLTTLERLFAELDQLWIIVEGERVLGVFVTTLCRDDDEKRFIGVSGLSGTGAKRWAALMSDKLAEYASEHGCASVRCYGRREWSRILPNISVIGQAANGHMIFERAA